MRENEPSFLGRLGLAWRALGQWMGRLNTVVWLTLFYWLLLTPLAFCLRMAGRDLLKRRKTTGTYWEEVEKEDAEGLRRQY